MDAASVGPRLRDGIRARYARGFAEPIALVLGLAVARRAAATPLVLGLTTPQNDFDTIFDHLWRAALWAQNGAAGLSRLRVCPVRQRVSATRRARGARDDGARRCRPIRRARPGRGIRRARARRRRGRSRPRSRQRRGTRRRPPGRDAPGDRTPVVHGPERPRRRLVRRRRRGLPIAGRPCRALARGRSGCPRRRDEGHCGRRRRRCSSRSPRRTARASARGSAWQPSSPARPWARTGTSSTGSGRKLGRGLPVRGDRPRARAHDRSGASLGDPVVELPGGAGRDRWLYAVAATCRPPRRARRVSHGAEVQCWGPRGVGGARAHADPDSAPLRSTRPIASCGSAVGRDDLAAGVGRDITRSASNVTWYGPLGALLVVAGLGVALVAARTRSYSPGSASLLALAPVDWLVALSALLFYQDAAGRFFMAPVALAGATWGLAARVRWAGGALTAIAVVTTLALAVLNDAKRPSGLPLLERPTTSSYFSEPRWSAQGREVFVPDLIRFVDERVPADASIALAITPSDPGYVVLGPATRPSSRLPRHRRDIDAARSDAGRSSVHPHAPTRGSARRGIGWLARAPLGLGAVSAPARALLRPKRATGLEPATFSLEG